MLTALVMELAAPSRLTGHRAIALANAKWFHTLAWKALRDGRLNGEIRAANARSAARIVLRRAQGEAVLRRLMLDADSA